MIEPEFLIDSNILIYVLNDPAGRVAARMMEEAADALATSSIVVAEVLSGASLVPPAARISAQRLLELLSILPFDEAAARVYADLPFKRGRFDRLIAAHALALGLTLITNNERDFADIPGLKVENWAA